MDHSYSDHFFPNMTWADNCKISLYCLLSQEYLSCCPFVVKQDGRLKSLKVTSGAFGCLKLELWVEFLAHITKVAAMVQTNY